MAGIVSLRELANRHGTDKGDRAGSRNNYTALYDPLFFSRRLERLHLLEIGLAVGGPEGGGPIERTANAPSIAMWLEYFPNAEIYGFDISDFSHLRHPRFHFIRGDLSSVEDLKRLADAAAAFDIIIDDGSHASYHQQLALGMLFSRLAPSGFYIIENLHWQSPVYESALPAVPKTGDLLHDAFVSGKPVGSAALPIENLRAIAACQPACSLFPSFSDDGSTRKLAVLRRTAGADDAMRPSVRSFDLFDTLVARRCYEPTAVFQAMEQRSGVKGFAACRRAAEATLYGTAYTLADIYQSLAQGTRLQTDVTNRLMNLELETEREVLFPIAETCAAFRPGDIVVSDMYLPPEFLRDVVQHVCRLPAARAYIAAEGKKSGQVWPVIRRDFSVTEHVGDNPATDIASAQSAGIPARLVTVAHRTRVESDLADAGYVPLSNLVREARLRGWLSDPGERRLQLLQVQVNFPLLFVATLRLAELAAEHGWQRVLFSGRDCYLWNELYALLAPLLGDVPSGVYFHSSRLPRAHPSADYLRYFELLRGDGRAAVADLVGTGWSLNRLIECASDSQTDIFLLHHLLDPNLRAYYEQQAAVANPIEPIACVRRGIVKGENEVLEELNRAPFPLLLDVEATQSGFRPIFEKPANQAAAGAVLQMHHAAFRSALMLLYGLLPETLAEMRRGNHEAMVVRLYQEMEGHAPNVPHFFPRKWHEEKIFREKIEAARAEATM